MHALLLALALAATPEAPPNPVAKALDTEKLAIRKNDASGVWIFCCEAEGKWNLAIPEYLFVRRYRALTGQQDLDFADVRPNRGDLIRDVVGAPVSFAVAAGGVFLATRGDFQSKLGAATVAGGAAIAVVGVLFGVGFSWMYFQDRNERGDPSVHLLTEAQGRAALERYNAKVEEQAPQKAPPASLRLGPIEGGAAVTLSGVL